VERKEKTGRKKYKPHSHWAREMTSIYRSRKKGALRQSKNDITSVGQKKGKKT